MLTKSTATWIGLLAVFVIASCTAVETPQDPPAVTPTAQHPTTSPATPPPTPTADLNRALWAEFHARATTYTDPDAQVSRSLGRATTRFDDAVRDGLMGEVAAAVNDMDQIFGVELLWLDAHPPAPCYATAHAVAIEWLSLLRAAAHLQGRVATGDAQAALDVLDVYDQADTTFAELNGEVRRTRC